MNRGHKKKGEASIKLVGHLSNQQRGCVIREASSFGVGKGLEDKALSSLPPGCVIWTHCQDDSEVGEDRAASTQLLVGGTAKP